MSGNVDIHARFTNALRTQAKTDEAPSPDVLPCPFCSHGGRIFQNLDQLLGHAKDEHASTLDAMDPRSESVRSQVRDEAMKMLKATGDGSSEATAVAGSTPDLESLSLADAGKGRLLPYSGKKRPAETEFQARRGKAQSPEIYDPDYSRDMSYTITVPDKTRSKQTNSHQFDPMHAIKGHSTPSREWDGEANRSQFQQHGQLPHRGPPPTSYNPKPQHGHGFQRQPGLLEIQQVDRRYPGLLLQPASRPISQEQLALEVKSIYAGLTMVETKCIHVDRAQAAEAAAAQENANANDEKAKVTPDRWQALIALHRTLLHEHHDFFLASQHPSASPALRRLASKYSMPARMWKHGIHSFLELLRRQLPESIEYMLAFIYLAYQMMALLYETVPAFEDTWIECLGDLGRYRMAIEDEDVRDRDTWASVARSWYSKAADSNPTVGRLYHHLAILARPNALQQLYYYARSLTCVKPFASARESILTLLDPILGRCSASYCHALPIDTCFIQAHGILFEKLSLESFEETRRAFLGQLDNHIGRVTAKWKEQGVYIAVTNIAGLFDYGSDRSVLRQILLLHAKLSRNRSQSGSASPSDEENNQGSAVDQISMVPSITEAEMPSKLGSLFGDFMFSKALLLTMSTFSLVLNRLGDKNVLPHAHVLLSFIFSFASIPHVAQVADGAPWPEIVTFLNTLAKPERPEKSIPVTVFPAENTDNLPLPEDYLIRGQLWSQWYFPDTWFLREHDEEDRYLELASTVRSRTERILNIGFHLSALDRWISYDLPSHTFSLLSQRISS